MNYPIVYYAYYVFPKFQSFKSQKSQKNNQRCEISKFQVPNISKNGTTPDQTNQTLRFSDFQT